MQPRVVLLTQIQSHARHLIEETLGRIGISVFEPKNLHESEQRLNDELEMAHAVLIVIDYASESPDNYYLEFELEVDKALEHHYNRPELQLIPIVQRNLSTPKSLLNFAQISFEKELSPYQLRQVVERILNAWHSSELKTIPTLDELLVEARIQLPRLSMLIPGSRSLEVIGLVLAATTTLLGIALSIPRVLSWWALPSYWLLSGAILFIAGGLATIYLFLRERRERKRTRLALLLKKELASVIQDIESVRGTKTSILTSE